MKTLKHIFNKMPALNATGVARIAGINASLFRQYIAGIKTPSSIRLRHIENTIHAIGMDMLKTASELRRVKLK